LCSSCLESREHMKPCAGEEGITGASRLACEQTRLGS
jgi:hypothetical protein